MDGNAREKFEKYLESTFPVGGKRSRSAAIHLEYANRIIDYLKSNSTEDKHFRHLVKRSKFQLLDLPKVGLRDVLVVQVKEGKEAEADRTMMKNHRRVAVVEEFWNILEQVHNKDCLHAGIKKNILKNQASNDEEPPPIPPCILQHQDDLGGDIDPTYEVVHNVPNVSKQN